MPLSPRAPSSRPDPAASDHFVDRQGESAALREALLSHVARCEADEIDGRVFRNVVSFYGIGGVGKTELSKNLERWITGASAPAGWGEAPAVDRVTAARWELNDSQGNLDPVPLLLAVRVALQRQRASWPAFDLAFAAYLTAARPGEPLPSVVADDLEASLRAIAGELGAPVTGEAYPGGIRPLVAAARRASGWSALSTSPALVDLLDRCLDEPGAEVPAELLWQLSLEIGELPAAERPALVVFVDHFERVQNAVQGTGEAMINRLVTSLPFALIVVTGRNHLDWYKDERVDLAIAGSGAWPSLVPGTTEGARQHLLDRLSGDDTLALLRAIRDADGLRLDDAVLDAIVVSTGGWPIHIDAVVTVARRLQERDPDAAITVEAVGGPLSAVVGRLLDELPDDEARVFQAACVLPYFDTALVKAVAGPVDDGAVRRCIARTLVLENPGSSYPYRVHDEIRAIVRHSAASVRRGWSGGDWAEAAERGSAHARDQFARAREQKQDLAQLHSTALGIRLAVENAIDLQWIADAVKDGPGITSLRDHVPASGTVPSDSSIHALIRLIEILDNPTTDETPDELALIGDDPLIGGRALRWRAYRLRFPLYRYDDAVAQFEAMIPLQPESLNLNRYQLAVTLTQARRFRSALARQDQLTPAHVRLIVGTVARSHGDLSSVHDQITRAQSPVHSRRFQLELIATHTIYEARLGIITPDEIAERLEVTRRVGHRSAERDLLRTLGYFHLCDDESMADIMRQLEILRRGRHESPAEAELLTLRAMATGRMELAEQARDLAELLPFRAASWIPTEVLLEQLGIELPPVDTEWVDSYDLVANRWQAIGAGIVERAKAR